METIKLWARNGEAVRQAIALGELVHLDTASEELTDEFRLFALQSRLLAKWAEAFPAPRQEPQSGVEVMVASPLAARFAGLSSMRKSGYVLRSASVLGALGSRVEVRAPAQGLAWRGPSDDKLISGAVLRKLLVNLEHHVDLDEPLRLPPSEPRMSVKMRQRACRRAVKGACEAAEAEARAQRVACQLMAWYNATVGLSLLDYARIGKGRRLPIVDTTPGEVPLETGTSACRGVVKNDDGSRARGYKVATVRTWLDQAGLITQVGLGPMQVPDLPVCRLFFETAAVLRAGDVLWEDRGFVDGATRTFLKQQRHVDVMVPLKSTRLSYHEAGPWAARQEEWQPQPARDHQHLAFVKGVEHLWAACQVPLNACGMRYGNRTKKALDYLVLVTTDQRLNGAWSVRHYEERPEMEPDDEQRNSGGWQLQKLRSTRSSEIVF